MGLMLNIALLIFCLGSIQSAPVLSEDDVIELDNEILAASRKLGVDDEEADGLISLLDEVKAEIDGESVDLTPEHSVKESHPVLPLEDIQAEVEAEIEDEVDAAIEEAAAGPIESIDEIESMQEIESIEPIKSIEEIKSIQNIKSIQEVPDVVAREFIQDRKSEQTANRVKLPPAGVNKHLGVAPTKEHILESLSDVIKQLGGIIEDVQELEVNDANKHFKEEDVSAGQNELDIEEISELQDVESVQPIKNINPIKSIQEVEEIYPLTDDQAARLRSLNSVTRRARRKRGMAGRH